MTTNPLAILSLVSATMAMISTPRADPDNEPIKNRLAPVQLQWNITGELDVPGGMGLHGRANGYLPSLPIYVGGGAAIFYGTEPSHLAGTRSSLLTRHLMEHTLFEVRAGFSVGGWTRRRVQTVVSYVTPVGGNQVLVTGNLYEQSYAAYRRWTVYAGYRRRSFDNPCPADASLPEDCADLSQTQLMLGFLDLFAVHSDIHTAKDGWIGTKRSKTWDVHALYTPGNDYARRSPSKQLGLEVEVTLGGGPDLAIVIGGGWDGELVLLTLGMGYGKPTSFTGAAPANRSIGE